MKTIKFFMFVALLLMATTSFAQFTNGGQQSSSVANTDSWQSFWFEWNPSSFRPDKGDSESLSFTGLSLGYSHSVSLSSSIPLFLEPGIGIQYSSKTIDDFDGSFSADDYEWDEGTAKLKLLSAKIPVNIEYSWLIPGSKITILPYAGITMRYNIWGRLKEEIGDDEDSYNLFSKDDMTGDGADGKWKRFQLGWQIGVKARIGKNFIIGGGYGTDFSEIAEKVKVGTGTISLGYTF